MSFTPHITESDSLAFWDIYRADQDELERRLAQLRLFREVRAERRGRRPRRPRRH